MAQRSSNSPFTESSVPPDLCPDACACTLAGDDAVETWVVLPAAAELPAGAGADGAPDSGPAGATAVTPPAIVFGPFAGAVLAALGPTS
jgi:hypothetical protein